MGKKTKGTRKLNANKSLKREVNKIKKKVFSGEVKYRQKNSTGTILQLSPATIHLTDIAQGTAQYERVGNDLNLISIGYNMEIFGHQATPNFIIRMVLFRCLKSGTPNLDELLVSGSTTGYNSFRNADYIKQYHVLADKKLTVNQAPYVLSGVLYSHISCKNINYQKKVNHKVTYYGAGSGNQSEGAVYLALFTNSGTYSITYDMESKIRYTDN